MTKSNVILGVLAGAVAIFAVIAFYQCTDDRARNSPPSGFVAPTYPAPAAPAAPARNAGVSGGAYVFPNGVRWTCDDLLFEFNGMNDALNDEFFAYQHVANLITLDGANPLALTTPRHVRGAVAECRR